MKGIPARPLFATACRTLARRRGFTLLEVLVALLVLSVGLLGLAGLQAHSLRNNHSAMLRSQAVALGYDMLDRMRSNRVAALAAGSAYESDYGDAESKPDCASNCSIAQIAQYDLGSWKAALSGLPGPGEGRVEIDNGRASVSIRWTDGANGGQSVVIVETLL
jgi:type IV pilus assembly protein PilV